jgi:hypothetical protein
LSWTVDDARTKESNQSEPRDMDDRPRVIMPKWKSERLSSIFDRGVGIQGEIPTPLWGRSKTPAAAICSTFRVGIARVAQFASFLRQYQSPSRGWTDERTKELKDVRTREENGWPDL